MIIHKIFAKNIFNVFYHHLKLLEYNFDYHTKSIIEDNCIVGAELFIYKIKKMNDNNFKIDKV